jgi:hypothetical protein
VIDAVFDAWFPQLSVTTNVAVYVPAGVKSCWTDAPVLVMPSLKYHWNNIAEQPTEPVLPASLKVTSSPTFAVGGEIVKLIVAAPGPWMIVGKIIRIVAVRWLAV